MIEQNHECYVDLEVAKLLKEAGFDWEVSHWYADKPDDKELYEDYTKPMNANQYMDPYHYYQAFSAPTIEVAQRWLREVKGLLLGMKVHDNSVHYAWEYTISSVDYLNLDGRDLSLIHWLCDNYNETENIIYHGKKFIPYEEVLEAGIKKALEIILEKGK